MTQPLTPEATFIAASLRDAATLLKSRVALTDHFAGDAPITIAFTPGEVRDIAGQIEQNAATILSLAKATDRALAIAEEQHRTIMAIHGHPEAFKPKPKRNFYSKLFGIL